MTAQLIDGKAIAARVRQQVARQVQVRHAAGLVLRWPIFMNISLAILSRIQRRGGVVAPRIERKLAGRYVETLSIRARGVDQEVAALSGGNQQKALLAKWLATEPRVLVLDDGQRTENQNWGDEHSPQIEAAEAERIEVVRGPASVLYGSDALGGVVNVVPRALPDGIGRPPFARVDLSAAYATNNRQPEGTLAVEGGDETDAIPWAVP